MNWKHDWLRFEAVLTFARAFDYFIELTRQDLC